MMDDKMDCIIDLYLIANCTFLIGPTAKPTLFGGLLAATGFNVCRECGDKMDGTCTPVAEVMILAVEAGAPNRRKVNMKTNAEYAKELGVSKRQVSKMRKRGELKE